MPVLYVVATPIGNLEDISLRALRILREVKLIAAEDTRKTKRLLNRYEIKTPLISFHEHSGSNRLTQLLEQLETGDIALVSEAGMPGISDPGYELVNGVVQQGVTVTPVPGPSAVTAALAVSGLSAERFLFVGFLPVKTNARRQVLENIAENPATLVIFEAPHRLSASLNDIITVLSDRNIAVCRELTKIHEEIFRGTISQAITYFAMPRGEFTLVIEGNREQHKPQMTENIRLHLQEMRLSGIPAREAIASTASETSLSRRELYRVWLGLA